MFLICGCFGEINDDDDDDDDDDDKRSVGSCPRVLHASFSCFPELFLVLDPRVRL